MNAPLHLPTELWLILPYIAFTSFVLGHIWRYRNDQFGWTTRSSQVYESRLLRLGSPLFHFGMVGVFGGHVLGVLIPESWTEAVGISEHTYHLIAVGAGSVAGLSVLAGVGILLYRRFTVTAVRKATTGNDKLMYALLTAALVTGLMNTWGANLLFGTYNYRETVSPWFRSLFTLNPQPELMVDTPGRSSCTASSSSPWSSCGPTPAWSTCSARRSVTWCGRMWCIGARKSPRRTSAGTRGPGIHRSRRSGGGRAANTASSVYEVAHWATVSRSDRGGPPNRILR